MVTSAEDIVAQFGKMISSNRGSLTLLEIDAEKARVRYDPGEAGDCERCVLTHEDLQELLVDVFQRNNIAVNHVDVV